MGRNKIDIQYLKDDRIRNITFNKRKNGLLKKACELAVLCNIKMLLCFSDLSGNVYQFISNENIEMEMIQSNHKKVFTKQDYPGFQKRKESESQSDLESEQSIEPKRTRAQIQQQQIQKINYQQQTKNYQQQIGQRNKVLQNFDKIHQYQQQPELQQDQGSRKMVKIENKQEEQDMLKSKMRVKNRMNNNDEIVVNDIIDHQQARNFDDLYQCGNQYDEQSNSQQDHQDYKQQLSMFTNSNPIKYMKMDSLLNGINNNNSKPINFLSEQYNKFFNKDRIDSLNNSKVLQPSVQFIVPPQVYFNIPPSPIVQAMNKVYVGVDEPNEYNLGQSQNMDGFKKYSK
ncbi:unnamed protein product [Paramecium sonneborni]|uniref:MADS-box domain-containing protein n=1 Tax=Paramecium sonneborni TaxID=65129 RepID=A0A8S1PIV5_9CILI|nr:unnamed protein product [Paramecium sonneborni]